MDALYRDLHQHPELSRQEEQTAAKLAERLRALGFEVTPAEEHGSGARRMLAEGLYTRFPKPDFALAPHNTATAASGSVEYVSGFALASVDSVDIVLHGKGGHGAYPETTVDPIVMAARTILSLQTLVSREKAPLEPAVITVGSIDGGTQHNIIPDDVKLQLTVRSYKPEVRQRLLEGIARVANAEAELSGAPRKPDVLVSDEATPATYNDPALTRRVVGAVTRVLGEQNVHETTPVMGGEDFAEYGLAGVPAVMLWVGTVAPARLAEAKATGQSLPSLHSALFVPDRERTLRTAVTTLTTSALELLGKP